MIIRYLIPAFCLAGSLLAQTLDRTKPPETPPLQPYKLPAARESKLGNGLSIMMVEDKRFPLVTVRLAFRAGSRYDPPSQPGMAETVASLIKSGTATKNSRQIAEELALIGGSIDAGDSPDSLIVSGSVLSDHTNRLLELMADVIRNGSFPQDELELRKQNRVQELSLQLSQSSTLASEKLHSVVFGAHPYAQTLPTPESIKSIKRQDLINFRDRLLTPGNAVLILVGALPPEKQALDMIKARFDSWTNKPVPAEPGGEIPQPKRSITLIDRPGSAQVDIVVGHVTVNRKHPDHYPIVMGDGILGGGASSRLFENIREKKGYAYHANSHNMPYKDTGLFQVTTQVREEVLEPAVTAVFEEMDRMGKEPVTAKELTDKKNYLNGNFVMRIASQDGVANQLASLRINDLPMDYLEQYVTRIRSVEPDQIERVAKKYLSSADASIVIVGDASKIAKTVEKFGNVTVEKAK